MKPREAKNPGLRIPQLNLILSMARFGKIMRPFP
jgi:hypothetical protein